MNKKIKNDYLLKGMILDYKKSPKKNILDEIIGIKFKQIRIDKNITVEAVVQDNKGFFNTVYDLYKFEKGKKVHASMMVCLSKYYKYDTTILFEQLN